MANTDPPADQTDKTMQGVQTNIKGSVSGPMLSGEFHAPVEVHIHGVTRPAHVDDEPPAPGDPPYKGLRYFDEADADNFFGRDAFTRELAEHVQTERFLALVGASGSGKSSVVRAGLIPALKRNPRTTWRVHVLIPTSQPLRALAAELTRDSESVTATATLIDDFQKDSRALDLHASRLVSGQNARLLVVVDQFEELFTLCKDPTLRQALVDNLLTAAHSDGPVTVVLSLRADFYHHCLHYADLRAELERHQKTIDRLKEAELRQAIEAPAQRGGWELETGLVKRVLDDAGDEPGALPLISHALLATWDKRRGRRLALAGYEATGGVKEALTRTADEMLNELTPAERAIAQRIFTQLTELGEGAQDTRRRAPLADLSPHPEQRADVERVLAKLASARLITTDRDLVEVAHEALIREWPTLRGWVDEDRAGLRLHRQLSHDAAEWGRLNRDEGLLYRGARLAQGMEWARGHTDELSALEGEFITSSQALAEREAAEREAQRQRELEAARRVAEVSNKLAVTERQAAHNLRRRAWYLAGVLGVALLAAVVAGYFGYAANQSAQLARSAEAQAQQQSWLALSRQLAAQARSVMEQELDLALLLSIEAHNTSETLEARSALMAALQHTPQLQGFLHNVKQAVLSSDGNILATTSYSDTLQVWNTADLSKPLADIGVPQDYTLLGFSPDNQIIVGETLFAVHLMELSEEKQVLSRTTLNPVGPAVKTVAISPDHHLIAVSGYDLIHPNGNNTLIVYDLRTGQALGPSLTENVITDRPIQSLQFSSDGRLLAAGSDAYSGTFGGLVLWDISAPAQPVLLSEPLIAHSGGVVNLAFSPDGRWLATAEIWEAKLWDISDPAQVKLVTQLPLEWAQANRVEGEGNIERLTFSPDGKHLVVTRRDGVFVLDISNPLAPRQTQQFQGSATSLSAFFSQSALAPDGAYIGLWQSGRSISLWNFSTFEPPLQQRSLDLSEVGSLEGAVFISTGNRLAVGSSHQSLVGTIAVIDLESDSLAPVWLRHSELQAGVPIEVAFSPDGNLLAAGGCTPTCAEGEILIWDWKSGQLASPPIATLTGQITALGYSPDGKVLAVGSREGLLRLWDVASEQFTSTALPTHSGLPITTLAFSPDARVLATGSADNTVILWDLAYTPPEPMGLPLRFSSQPVQEVGFISAGQTLFEVQDRIVMWDISTPTSPELLTSFPGSDDFSGLPTFSARGDLAATLSQSVITLWDVTDIHLARVLGQMFLPEEWATRSIADLTFSPDSATLVVVYQDGQAVFWDVQPASWIAHACQIAHRNLTLDEWAQYLPDQPYRKTCEQWSAGQ